MSTEEEFEEWRTQLISRGAYLDRASSWVDWAFQQQKIDRLKEGINTALSYNLPYLAEKVLREALEESK